MSSSETWRIELPAGTTLLTANGMRKQGHWSKYYTTIADLRKTTRMLAAEAGIPHLLKAKIKVTYHPPDNRRRDPHNWWPSVKAGIDGIVDAGVLPDDSRQYLTSVELTGGENVKLGQLVFDIYEVKNDGRRA
jgi:hypothetical protein